MCRVLGGAHDDEANEKVPRGQKLNLESAGLYSACKHLRWRGERGQPGGIIDSPVCLQRGSGRSSGPARPAVTDVPGCAAPRGDRQIYDRPEPNAKSPDSGDSCRHVRPSGRPSVRPIRPIDTAVRSFLTIKHLAGGQTGGGGGAAAARCSAVAFIDIMYGKWISDDAGECSLTPTFALA